MSNVTETLPNYKDFIQDLIDQEKRVSIYLVNGIKLQGVIVYNDLEDNSLILTSGMGTIQKIYCHATSTIVTI